MLRRLPTRPVLALVAWSVFLWLSRLRNVLGNDDLTGWGTAWRVIVVAVFVGLAIAAWTGRLVTVLVVWTVAFWVVRGGGILLDDHDIGFTLVHTALMAVSIGLAMWVWRTRDR